MKRGKRPTGRTFESIVEYSRGVARFDWNCETVIDKDDKKVYGKNIDGPAGEITFDIIQKKSDNI